MKKAALFFGAIFLLFGTISSVIADDVNILILIPNYYSTNYNLHKDNFELMGWNVTLAAASETVRPCPNYAGPMGNPIITADTLASDITDITKYDCVAIMSGSLSYGSSASDLIASADVLNLVKMAADSGLAIAAFASGVRVLAAADVISGKNVTGDARYTTEYVTAGATYLPNSPPIIDGYIVTANMGSVFSLEACDAVAAVVEKTNHTNSTPGRMKNDPFLAKTTDLTGENILWAKTFGGAASEGGRKVIQTGDAGFVFIGYTYSQGAGQADILMIKIDADGNELWNKTYGGPGWEYAYNACEAPDGGFLITGYSTSFGDGDRDAFLLKTDADGNQQCFNIYGGDSSEVGRAITNCPGGGYLICGTTSSFGSLNQDIYVLRIDANGNEMDYRVFPVNLSEFANAVIEADDGGYVIAGSSLHDITAGFANRDIYVLKIDINGYEVWSKFVHHNYYDSAFDIAKTPDGGYIITGDTDLEGQELLDIYTVKLDSEGNEVWNKRIGESKFYDYSRSICATSDGGYVICGTTKSVETGNDLYLVKIDSLGNILWKEVLGDAGSDWGHSISETSDGNYIITGHTNSFGNGGFDVWAIHVSGLRAQYNLAPSSGHAPLQVQFSDQSQGKPNAWQWDFNNDGVVDSEVQNPTWVFDTPGDYTVKLTVQDEYTSKDMLFEKAVRVFDGESALQFDGLGSYACCPANESINFTNKLTLEAWIKPYSWGGYSFGNVFDKSSMSVVVNGVDAGFSVNSMLFIQSFSDGEVCYTNTRENSIILDTWQYIAVTYDGAANTAKIYINGVEQQVEYLYGTPGNSMADNKDIDLFVGCSRDLSMPFDGLIDEIRVWNNILDGNQILANMERYLKGTESGLLGYWQLNEGYGNTTTDFSGKNTLSINGTNWVQGIGALSTRIRECPNDESALPNKFIVEQNYPNPFNPKTIIKYAIPAGNKVTVKIYNVLGKEVAVLYEGQQAAGYYEVEWDAINYSSGVYFYHIQSGSFKELHKMLLIK